MILPQATSSCGRSRGTTTPGARTTSSAGSTGRPSSARPACCASRASLIAARRRAQELLDLPIDVTLEELLATARHRLAWRGAGPAGSLARLAKPRGHDQRPLGGAPHHRQRLLGAARLRASRSPRTGAAWQRILDTTLASPDDIRFGEEAPAVETASYRVGPRSVVVLAARPAVPQEAYP